MGVLDESRASRSKQADLLTPTLSSTQTWRRGRKAWSQTPLFQLRVQQRGVKHGPKALSSNPASSRGGKHGPKALSSNAASSRGEKHGPKSPLLQRRVEQRGKARSQSPLLQRRVEQRGVKHDPKALSSTSAWRRGFG